MTTRDKDKEALSALMDGESQELELRRSLDSVEDDDALRAWWSRQQQISEILQSQRSSQTGLDVSARVRSTLASQPQFQRNPLWSMAIAASVTLAVVMGGQALLPTAELAPAPLVSDIGGAVVPVMGAQPIRASFDARPVPVSTQQAQGTGARQTAAAYERLARDRYLRLGAQHARAAALNHPAPFVHSMRAQTEPPLEVQDSK